MVRDDLADVALADRVFAPHYTRAIPRVVASAADLLAKPKPDADISGSVAAGETVELFDVSGGWAWVRAACGPGYVPVDVLGAP